jgi:hypothetical protein
MVEEKGDHSVACTVNTLIFKLGMSHDIPAEVPGDLSTISIKVLKVEYQVN